MLFSERKELKYLPPRYDAFILFGTGASHEIDTIRGLGCPMVNMYEHFIGKSSNIPEIAVDFSKAFSVLAKYFSSSGVRRCAYLGQFLRHRNARGYHGINERKFENFKEAMRAESIEVPPEMVIDERHNLAGGYRAVKKLFEKTKEKCPEAIFLCSDILAPGAYKALREMNLNIPGDVLIAGCDNMEIGEYVEPELTTMNIRRREIGQIAAREILKSLFDRKEPESVFPNAEVIFRKSTDTTKKQHKGKKDEKEVFHTH